MKKKTVSALLISTAVCTFPAYAADANAAPNAAAAEEIAAEETVSYSVVTCKGGG